MNDASLSERQLVGALLMANDNRTISFSVASGLTPCWFSDPQAHRAITVILAAWQKNRPIDPRTIGNGGLSGDQTVDSDFVASCLEACATPMHAEHYLELVQDAYTRRQLKDALAISQQMLADDTETPAFELAAVIQDRFFRLSGNRVDGRSLADVGMELITGWEHPERIPTEVVWPIESVQTLIGSLSDEYVILASKPSIGKTAFSLQMGIVNAVNGRRVSIASLESKRDKITQRLIACIGRCHTLAMRRGIGRPQDFTNARAVAEQLKTLPLIIEDQGMTIEQLRAWAMREKSNGSKLLIVDNFKHIRTTRSYKSRVDQFADISLHLKFIRDDTGLPLIILHHLSAEDRLAWSADIERDADIIVILERNDQLSIIPCRDNHWIGRDVVNLRGYKNRDGQTGVITIEFEKSIQRFREVEG